MGALIRHLARPYGFLGGLYVLVIWPVLNLGRIRSDDSLSLLYVFYWCPYLFWVVLGGLFISEQTEYRNNGRFFLKTLPIHDGQLMAARFLVVETMVLILVVFHLLVFLAISDSQDYYKAASGFLLLIAALARILAAFLHIGLHRFGFARIGRLVLIFWILVFTSPLLLREFVLPGKGLLISDFVAMAAELPAPLIFVLSAFLFWALLLGARMIRPKSLHPFRRLS